MVWHRDWHSKLGHGRRICSAVALYLAFEEELVFLVGAVDWTGFASQFNGLADCREGIRDPSNTDLMSPSKSA